MTKEEFTQKIQEITNSLDDQGKVTSLLSELSGEYEKVFDDKENLTTINNDLTTKNQELKNYNLELFMKVGTQDKKEDNTPLGTPGGKEEDKLKFEDLFDEKGEFK